MILPYSPEKEARISMRYNEYYAGYIGMTTYLWDTTPAENYQIQNRGP